MNEAHKTILIDLDSILDTRIATIATLNPKVASMFLSKEYLEREMDDFETLSNGLIKQSDYLEAYSKRGREVLELSRPTKILEVLNVITRELSDLMIESVEIETVTVSVNMFPYKLNSDEKEAILSAIGSYVPIGVKLKSVYINPKKLSAVKIKDIWDHIFIYDFDEWFKENGNSLNTLPIPRHSMTSAIKYINKPTTKDLDVLKKEGVTPFEVLSMSMVDRIDLTLLPIEYFSINLLE